MITTCNDTYKFAAYLYSILQEFTVDSKVMVTNHPEATNFDKIMKGSAFAAYELHTP